MCVPHMVLDYCVRKKQKEGSNMRVRQHSGRAQGSAKHNDRSFTLPIQKEYLARLKEKPLLNEADRKKLWNDICNKQNIDATNINPDFIECNYYWDWRRGASEGGGFEECEKLFYEKNYSADLERKNAAYLEKGHPERVRTIDQVLKNKKTAPEEVIVSVGKMGDKLTPELISDLFNSYVLTLDGWNREHGNHMHILDMTIHGEEDGIPHLHMRRTWDYVDKYGNRVLNQNKALELAGVELPNPDKPISRYNNRKMTFDAMMRDKWISICEEKGLKIEKEPLERKRSLSVKEYKLEKDIANSKIIKKSVADFFTKAVPSARVFLKKKPSQSEILQAISNLKKAGEQFVKDVEPALPVNTKSPEDDELSKVLKDWKNMSQARREEEELKAYLKEVHMY